MNRESAMVARAAVVVRRSTWTTASARPIGGAVAVLALVAAPWLLDDYTISMLSRMLVLGLLAMSVNLLAGITGLPTLGQAAYFGVGAYSAAILARSVTAVGPPQIALAALIAGAVAVATGTLAVRARGTPFLMLTLAIGQLTAEAADQWERVTNGTDGLSGIPAVVPFWGMPALKQDGHVYGYVLVLFLLLFAAITIFVRSPLGLALRGMRENEARMRALGYPVTRFLLAAYGLAGMLAGAAGALWVSVQQFVSPGDLGFEASALALLAVVIGGLGSMVGSGLGAALVVFTRDYLGAEEPFVGRGHLLLGALFIVAVYLLPRGLAGIRLRRSESVREER